MRHALQLEVIGEDRMSADVGKHGESGGGNDGATDGEPVQSIGEVHGVARADDDQGDEENEGQKREYTEVGNRTQQHVWIGRDESA